MMPTEKATLKCHCKGYDDGDRSLQKATLTSMKKDTLTCQCRGYNDRDGSLQRLHWRFSDSDFAVSQCPVKSSRLFSDSEFAVSHYAITSCRFFSFNEPLLWGYIKTCLPEMHFHTSLTHNLSLQTHTVPSSTCLATCSPHGTGVHSTIVNSEQSWPSLSCRPRMEGGVGCVLCLTQMAS
jgi:hypothetical protein